jgi:DNA-directed RNA polymerase specialized sigma subunit
MVLTEAQRTVVENNMGLVGTVMKEKLNGGSALSYYSYDDLFQIGCIGLCKAAATDNGIGCFSTYSGALFKRTLILFIFCPPAA